MDQQTHYGYALLSLLQALQVFQFVLLLLANFTRLRWYVNGVGNSISNQTTNMILSKMKSIKEYAELLLFHLRWILAHGEIAFLYAEDLSIYIQRRHPFHPKIYRVLEDISEQDCYTWFSQNNENIRRVLLHLRVPPLFTHQSNGAVYAEMECFLIYLYHLTKGSPFTEMA